MGNKLLPGNFLKRGNMAPAKVMEEEALEKGALKAKAEEQVLEKEKVMEASSLKTKVAEQQSRAKLLNRLKKGKFMTKEELAAKAKAEEKAFREKLLANLL